MTLISNVRYQKKRNESDIKMDFQNLVLFMMIGTKSSRSWGLLRNIFAIFINLSIFVWEYRTRRPVIPHVNERYVTKPQTSHNTMQKTRLQYLNLERFYWVSVFARQKKTLCRLFCHTYSQVVPCKSIPKDIKPRISVYLPLHNTFLTIDVT